MTFHDFIIRKDELALIAAGRAVIRLNVREIIGDSSSLSLWEKGVNESR